MEVNDVKHYEANRLIRSLLLISQQDIADYLGCTKQTVCNYEKGKTEKTWYYKMMNKMIDNYLDTYINVCESKTVKDCCERIKSDREEL